MCMRETEYAPVFALCLLRRASSPRSASTNAKTTSQIATELITNNAAAALATPIAFSISRELGVRCVFVSARSVWYCNVEISSSVLYLVHSVVAECHHKSIPYAFEDTVLICLWFEHREPYEYVWPLCTAPLLQVSDRS